MDTETVDWQTRHLYKYMAFNANTLALIVNREVYFAGPDRLNDPYDCQVSVTGAIDAAIAQAGQETARKVVDKLERFRKLSEILTKMERDTRGVGVLSLSQDNLNVLMWSHYADEHRGLCLGFRFSPKITEYHEANKIIGTMACHYCLNNPFSDFFIEFAQTDELVPWEEFWPAIISLGMASKSEAWRHENEVRVLRTEPGFVSFQPEELTEVIFGMRTDQRARNTVRRILSGGDWAHLKYRQVVKPAEGFGLVLVDA
jgi:hypothetical protein